MGCGKSFVLSCFAAQGWLTVETDAITRDLLANDPEVARDLRELFGDGVFDTDGRVDRAALAGLVFGDDAALRFLEGALHPRVRKVWLAAVDSARDADVIVEIPLLFEKNLEKLFDLNVCVSASLSTQIERLARRGFGKNEALARMARQLPLRDKELRADFVISNNGNPEFARTQVTELIGRIAHRFA
jgi:dephospho-CoA kinase